MNAIGYLNSSGSSSVRIRLPSVWMSSAVSSRRIMRQVLLGARVVVVPRGARSRRAEAAGRAPPQAHEREPAVVVDVAAMGERRRVELCRRRRGAGGAPPRSAAAAIEPRIMHAIATAWSCMIYVTGPDAMTLIGLHHVTATVDDAQDDLDFCLGGARPAAGQEDRQLRQPSRLPLLLRRRARHAGHHLDDVSVQGSRRAGRLEGRRPGHGHVVLGADRLARRSGARGSRAHGIAVTDIAARFGEPVIRFADRSGLDVRADRDRRATIGRRGSPRASTRDAAIRGLHSVTMVVRDAGARRSS